MKPSARDLVCEHLAEVIPRFPDLPIGGLFADSVASGGGAGSVPALAHLDARDIALARALDGAVRRRWVTLEYVLAASLTRPIESLEPRVLAALLVGAAQLLLFDRLPDHAVVDEAVSYVRHAVRPGAAGFVNGVLRSTARRRDAGVRGTLPPEDHLLAPTDLPRDDGTTIRFLAAPREVALFGDPPDRSGGRPGVGPGPRALALQTSLAPSLVERWWSSMGPVRATAVALGTIVPAPTIIRNPPPDDPRVRPHRSSGFGVFVGHPQELLPLLNDAPDRWVQDPTSAAAIDAIAPGRSPRIVVDLCAGRGTKTRQLSNRFTDARILACDPDPARAATLRAVFAGDRRVEVIPTESIEEQIRALGGADLVVLDVPCSNSGVLARRLEARYRFDQRRLDGLTALQRRIISTGIPLLAPEGSLLYCTCSLEAEENQHQWAWIESSGRALLARGAGDEGQHHRGHRLTRVASDAIFPSARPGAPPDEHRDGGAWALFTVPPATHEGQR